MRVPVKFSRTPVGVKTSLRKDVLTGKYKRFYSKCFFPTAGNRNNTTGALNNRAYNGNYWSSTENSTNAYNLNFNSGAINPANNNNRTNGFSVRCIAELNNKY
ncbi:hypothetical protein ACP3T3_00735 [Chryseobacterium sp. CBSDS_008]|uniref:hypothetical protein n=1 Tax=Chryseobacterium sp. CBSDS_008 TaxID=3415265 RepID=UPI003CF36ACF